MFYTAMIKIAGTKSNDKINFKEFVDFFYKVDWVHIIDLLEQLTGWSLPLPKASRL